MKSAAVAEPVQSAYAVEHEDVAARCAVTTLITASTATDVEHLARRIHAASSRAAFSFVHASAAALPVEACELLQTCAGLIDAAAGGTLLLTAVEEMPAGAQDRFIETFAQLQSIRDPSAAVRLMAGTTVSLLERIADGAFSERLFYRLNIIHVLNGVPTPSNAQRTSVWRPCHDLASASAKPAAGTTSGVGPGVP